MFCIRYFGSHFSIFEDCLLEKETARRLHMAIALQYPCCRATTNAGFVFCCCCLSSSIAWVEWKPILSSFLYYRLVLWPLISSVSELDRLSRKPCRTEKGKQLITWCVQGKLTTIISRALVLLVILIGSQRCLHLLWLVRVIAFVLLFWQSFENRSNTP